MTNLAPVGWCEAPAMTKLHYWRGLGPAAICGREAHHFERRRDIENPIRGRCCKTCLKLRDR